MENIIEFQNIQLREEDRCADIRQFELDGLTVREAYLSSYPTPEITIFREYDRFVAFIVLFCPDYYIRRDTKKAVSMLNKALPIIMNNAITDEE